MFLDVISYRVFAQTGESSGKVTSENVIEAIIFPSQSWASVFLVELYRVHINPLVMAAPHVTSCLYIWALHDQALPPPFLKLGIHVAFSDTVSPAGVRHAETFFSSLPYSHLL